MAEGGGMERRGLEFLGAEDGDEEVDEKSESGEADEDIFHGRRR